MLLPSALCQEPVRIGIVTELTGKNALAGQQARRGSQLAVAEINRAGGIHGRRFEALLEDSASNNAGAVSALNKLAGRGDLAGIIAPIRSTQVLAELPRINEIGLPTMTGATNENITRLGCRWIFRNRTNDGLAAQLAVVYASDPDRPIHFRSGAASAGPFHLLGRYFSVIKPCPLHWLHC